MNPRIRKCSLLHQVQFLQRLPVIANELIDNWIDDGLGPVNTMRLVLACLENQPPTFLEEVLFIPDYNYGETGQLIRRIPASAK